MGYYIDLTTISIDSYRVKLESAYLPPSRLILKDNLSERFNYFKEIGIKNVQELQHTLKKKNKFAELSNTNILSENYLTILLREINSLHPKPNKISEFAGISSYAVSRLAAIGITNTVTLFDRVKTSRSREELAVETGISDREILELAKLTDLSRIKWVGVSFARMLYDTGIDTVEKASMANYNEVHTRINQLNKDRNIFRGQIGLNDMKILVSAAKDVPLEIEY